MTDSYISGSDTAKKLQTELNTVGWNDVHAENVIEQSGTFAYLSQTLTAGNITVTGRIRSLRVYAQTTDGSFNIGGGDTITVRTGTGFDISPRSQLDNAVINWVSGTLDIFIEYVA